MYRHRLATGLTVAFAAMSAVLAVAGVLGNPIALVVATVFAGVAALLWYDASGRLASRVYRRVERRAAVDGGRRSRSQRGGFGAGPRDDWSGPHRRRGRETARQARTSRRTAAERGPTARSEGGSLTAREARDVLDLDAGADADAIRAAYRDRIKDVHPDAPGGDEAAFRRVRAAYERLSE